MKSQNNPIKQTLRRIPLHMQNEIDKLISEMQAQGIIKDSSSSWCSPVVLKRKKDGSIRFSVDFRKLNAVTIKDSLSSPRTDDTLERQIGNSWFSTLDLKWLLAN